MVILLVSILFYFISLKQRLTAQKHLCLTADVWSSRAQSYLGVTVHFLNDNYQRESYLLAFKQLRKRQTYDVLAEELHSILKDYEIDTSKITHIVTDGGSSFCKMFKKFGESIDITIIEEREIDSDSNADEIDNTESDQDIVQSFMTDENGEEFVNEIITLGEVEQNSENTEFDDELHYFQESQPVVEATQPQIKLPPQRRCVSHILNLVSKDFEKNLHGLAQKSYEKMFDSLRPLWYIVRKSSRAKDICKEILGITLKYPCVTRWNSQFDCIKQLNEPEINRNFNNVIEAIKLNLSATTQLTVLTSSHFGVMAQYEKVFSPVAAALDILQGEFSCSQGSVLPVLVSMKFHISQLEENNNVIRDKEATLKVIDARFKKIFEFNTQNKEFILSSISHPSLKDTFIVSNENKLFAKNLLISECRNLAEASGESGDDNQIYASANEGNGFILSFPSGSNNRRNSIEDQIENEISQFLRDIRKEVNILNEYPRVRTVFFKYNTTLSSSAPVERVFSQSLMIFTPRRNRISSDNFEKTLMLKHNRKLIVASTQSKE